MRLDYIFIRVINWSKIHSIEAVNCKTTRSEEQKIKTTTTTTKLNKYTVALKEGEDEI